jgi:peptide/nickel transport system permease protein
MSRHDAAPIEWPRRIARIRFAWPSLDPLMLGAFAAFVGLLVPALLGDRIAPHEPIYFVVEHGSDPRPYDPGLVFPLGSDVLGRDLFSLVLAGARATLTIVLLSGIARVVAGVVVATLGTWWRPARVVIDMLGELASAIPATLVALFLVKVFVRTETSLLVFIGALLVTGWAGPYRVIRAELDRLAVMPFTQGARAMGVGRSRLFWRHHLPHVVPVLATNTSQQIVASLVLVAELGVLGAALGVTRTINIAESLSLVLPTQVNSAQIPDPPEWGGLLANARTIESLWTTRWLIFVPGVAFAIAAVAIGVIGFALARRYATRDVIADLRSRSAAAFGVAVLAMFVVSSLVPERYVAAREWAADARAELRPTVDIESAFGDAGLRPIGPSFGVTREISSVVQTGPASVSIAGVRLNEPFPHSVTSAPDRGRTARSFVTQHTGGGVVEAPLVFAGRGISADDYEPTPQPVVAARRPDFARLIRDYNYADDYAGIDVRGKVVLLTRFVGIAGPGNTRLFEGSAARGPLPEDSIKNAIKRGAAAVIFVDPALYLYTDIGSVGTVYGLGDLNGGNNPYLRDEQFYPATSTGGVPVFVVGDTEARRLAEPLGIDLSPFFRFDERGAARYKVSPSRDLGVTARVEVPLERQTATVTSYVAEIAGAPADAGRIVVWSPRRDRAPHPSADVLAALGRSLADRRVPVVLVDFDPAVNADTNAKLIGELLKDRRIELVVVLDRLDGPALRLTTPHGDLIPAFDLYAEKAGAPHVTTLTTPTIASIAHVAPFFDVKTVLVEGSGGEGDARADAAALVGYLAGRLALGAEELPQ